MSDRRERDRDRERRRRSRSRSPRDRRRDRDSHRRERGRDSDRGRDRREFTDDRAATVDIPQVEGSTAVGLSAISGQLEEETQKRRDRVAAWREAQKRLAQRREAEERDFEEGNDKQFRTSEGVFESAENSDGEDTDSDEDEVENCEQVSENGNGHSSGNGNNNVDDNEIDPLDAFMADLAHGEAQKRINEKPVVRKVVITATDKEKAGPSKGDIIDNEDEVDRVADDFDIAEEAKNLMAKSRHLIETDHSKVYYKPFRKDFYVEVPDIARLTKKQVDELRADLDNIKVRGKRPPKPIKNWAQAGVELKVMNTLKHHNYTKPTPIQAQAIPAILSGRDVIGVAKTGSGKTLAFLLPMFRHIRAQDTLEELDGPIGIVLSPTRELALQTYKEANKFCKPLGLRCVCVYGGVGISDQIGDLKKGAEIVVCTPGRMIDMLAANGGKVTNLRRVTYLVLDEADRMFDLGFEPQVMKIVNNIRPDRQTVLFSATFPKKMEGLARKILKEPIEIQVGGKSVVCADVDQHALVVDEHVKLLKLLELLGQYAEYGSVLVFVEKQEKADELVSELMTSGYNCAPLHGGIDQFDRDSTLIDFKCGKLKILVATSVAARGLDVKKLILVVNYDCPNHYEDYVHRVGRTGRAGNKGYAYTFILPQGQERLAGEVCRAFQTAGLPPPADVKELFEKFKNEQEAEGKEVILGGGGFSGSGFKYDDAEDEHQFSKKTITKIVHGFEAGADEDDASIDEQLFSLMKTKSRVVLRDSGASADDPFGFKAASTSDSNTAVSSAPPTKLTKEQIKQQESKTAAAHAAAAKIAQEKQLGAIVIGEKDATSVTAEAILKGERPNELKLSAKAKAAQIAERLNSRLNYLPSANHPSVNPDFHMNYYEEELEINDFPQQLRYKESIAQVQEFADVGISVKGTHYTNGREPREGQDRKLYLLLEARDEFSLRRAKEEIIRIMRETLRQLSQQKQQVGGRYKLF